MLMPLRRLTFSHAIFSFRYERRWIYRHRYMFAATLLALFDAAIITLRYASASATLLFRHAIFTLLHTYRYFEITLPPAIRLRFAFSAALFFFFALMPSLRFTPLRRRSCAIIARYAFFFTLVAIFIRH